MRSAELRQNEFMTLEDEAIDVGEGDVLLSAASFSEFFDEDGSAAAKEKDAAIREAEADKRSTDKGAYTISMLDAGATMGGASTACVWHPLMDTQSTCDQANPEVRAVYR